MKILEYHEIVTGQPQEIHAVQAACFYEQMTWLSAQGFQVIHLSDYVDRLRNKDPQSTQGKSKKQPVALTFDDGYQDNYTNALSILNQYNFPATIFLTTGLVGKYSSWRQDRAGKASMLTWDQMREMSHMGIEFGSHTINHADLTQLDPESIERELHGSRQDIENQLGRTVSHFSYPFSRSNPGIQRMVQRAGYQAACTYQPFFVGEAGQDLFNLQRIGILAGDELADFAEKVNATPARRIKWMRYLIRTSLYRRLGISTD